MHLIAFALKTLPAEVKSNWQRSLLIILCLAVGIASVSAVKIYTDSALSYFKGNVKEFFGADITIQLPEELTPEQEEFLEKQTLGILTFVDNYNQVAFNPFNRQKNMPAQVTVIDPNVYPLYGSLALIDDSLTEAVLSEKQAAVVSASLYEQLELKLGNLVLVGNTPYVIRGILKETNVPDGFMGRIFTATSPQAELGSLGTKHAYLKLGLEHDLSKAKEEISQYFEEESIASYTEVSTQIDSSAKILGNVALIAALASLLLGGLGVANASQVIARQKIKQSAIMKCLGGKTRQVTFIIIIQIAFIGFIGILAGFVLGWALTGVLPNLLKDILSFTIPIKPNLSVFLQIAALGMLVTVLFSLLPVLRFTKIRPLAVYRDDNPEKLLSKNSKLITAFTVVVLAAILGIFIGFIIDSPLIGLGFAFVTLLLTSIFLGLIKLILKLILKLPIYLSTTGKMARRSLSRQASRASGAILALSLGISSILLISFVQSDVLTFIQGIQKDQKTPNIFALLDSESGPSSESLLEFLKEDDRVESVSSLKMLTASLETINDQPFEPTQAQDPRMAFLAKAFMVGALDPQNMPLELNYTEGEPLSAINDIVMEGFIASSLNLELGDKLGLLIGQEFREYNLVGFYSNMETGVNISTSSYASNASLEGLNPSFATEIVFARTKPGISGEDVISALRANFPDLGFAFDIGQLLNLLNTIFTAISRFMQFLGLFALVSGLIILAGTMILTKWEKRKETALIRCLGGTTKDVISAQLWENGILGILSATIGIWLANMLSMFIDVYLLELEFVARPVTNIVSFILVLLAVLAVGSISLWDVLTERPLSVLRNE